MGKKTNSASMQVAHQAGLSLVELMVGLTLGLIVVGAGISLLTSTVTSNTSTMFTTRANQDLRGSMNFISHDLARAGHWGVAADIAQASRDSDLLFSATSGSGVTVTAVDKGTDTSNGSFGAPLSASNLTGQVLVLLMTSTGSPVRHNVAITGRPNDNQLTVTITGTLPSKRVSTGGWTILNPFSVVRVFNVAGGVATDVTTTTDPGNCIVMRYDLDNDGVVDSNENFGYRLDATNGAIETTTTATTCVAGDWDDLTDTNDVNVTAFSVSKPHNNLTTSAADLLTISIRAFTVQMTAQRRSDPAVVRSLRETVKVRNDMVS